MSSPSKVKGWGPDCRCARGITACQKRRNTGCRVVSMEVSLLEVGQKPCSRAGGTAAGHSKRNFRPVHALCWCNR